MFSDVEAFALLCLAKSVNEDRRRAHAREVVQTLALDERLEPLVPLPPTRRTLRAAYQNVISTFTSVSQHDEPDRTKAIEEIYVAAGYGNDQRCVPNHGIHQTAASRLQVMPIRVRHTLGDPQWGAVDGGGRWLGVVAFSSALVILTV